MDGGARGTSIDITVVHNPGAGKGVIDQGRLLRLLTKLGYNPIYRSTRAKDYAEAVATAKGLVVAAGGDGTIRRVAIALAQRNAPLAILPLGTANNVAGALGIDEALPLLAAGWKRMHKRRIDLGVVDAPWGSGKFIESVGVGWFSDTMARLDRNPPKTLAQSASRLARLRRARRDFLATLAKARCFEATVTVDRKRFAGRFLLIEAMNLCQLGPNLALAPHADPGDGMLDVVMVRSNEREALRRYLAGEKGAPPPTVARGRRVTILSAPRRMHIDDKPGKRAASHAQHVDASGRIRIVLHVERSALDVLAPA